MVRQRWLSTALFRNAARPGVIRSVLKQAYPSGSNIDDAPVNLLYQPTQRDGATEAFRGFINLFDDHLAPQLMDNLCSYRSDLGGKGSLGTTRRGENWPGTIPTVRSPGDHWCGALSP